MPSPRRPPLQLSLNSPASLYNASSNIFAGEIMTKIHIITAILLVSFCAMTYGQETSANPEGTVLQPEPNGIEVSENAKAPDGYSVYSRLGIGLGADAAY